MKKHLCFIIFLALFLTIGLSIYHDYGVSWDEDAQITIGKVNYQYIAQGNPYLLTFTDRYYGPLFEVLLWRLTGNLPNPDMVYYRHLGIFLVFALGMIALYALAYRLFHNSWWSLLTVILLALSPRIFAESFYNSKDIPFLAFFTIAVLAAVFLFDVSWSDRRWRVKIGAIAFSTLACAATIDTRVPGIALIALTSILLVLIVFCNPKRWKSVGVIFATYLVLATGLVILFWPVLWHNPVKEFIKGFTKMSHYPWHSTMLFRGEFIMAMHPVWDYIPTWISITTPLLPLAGFVLGVFSLVAVTGKNIVSSISKSFRSFRDRITPDTLAWLLIVGWSVVPLAALFIFHSIVYDGWRQLYFIYPSMLLIAVFGMKTVYEQLSRQFKQATWLKMIAGTILLVGLLEPLVFTLRYHPNENVYFNILAGDPAALRQNFDLDYWGLSYKQGIDYILAHDPSPKIKLADAESPGRWYITYLLPADQASRLVKSNLADADYFISTFRWHPDDYYFGKEYYSIDVRGAKIMTVYKLK